MSTRQAFGAAVVPEGTKFSVWALGRTSVSVEIEGTGSVKLTRMKRGIFEAIVPNVVSGARYKFRVDRGQPLPDPASRWQPMGNDGPSEVVVNDYDWTDAQWGGVDSYDQVVYELHIGTFTAEGTWTAAKARLSALSELGITVVQVMPVGTFKGRFGWGYDTTMPYAPFAAYGSPNDMRAFVNKAHDLEIGVILDVVYNHAGVGDHYRAFSEHYLSERRDGEWGAGFNFDGEGAPAVRDFIVGNAVYWVQEFHLDGLRIDACQAMIDTSREHIVAEITRAVRAAAAPRSAYVIVENQPQEHRMVDPPVSAGYGVDAMISDDFHHSAHVAFTGYSDFYYRDYLGTPQELVSALKYGFLYQGQRSDMRDGAYGTYNLDTPPERFVHFLENHDQIANSARGFRLSGLVAPARLRALTALLLLGPQTPCLFQGQEFGATNPFLYFSGLENDEAIAVAEGRRKSLSNFPGVADPAMQRALPDPSDPATFESSKLDWSEAERHAGLLALHTDLLALRRNEPTFHQRSKRRIDGAIIGDAALLVRYLTEKASGHRLLLVNLGRDLQMGVAAEPLLAPPDGHYWRVAWSSDTPSYGGNGQRPTDPGKAFVLPANCALLLRSVAKG